MTTTSGTVEVSGLSFIEFSSERPKYLDALFSQMGLAKVGAYESNSMSLYAQEDVRFISNSSMGANAELFRSVHGCGACAMGFKVRNSSEAFELAIRRGAEAATKADHSIPAIRGVGKSLIYLVDEASEQRLFSSFGLSAQASMRGETCLEQIDHVTHNLKIGGIERMSQFYENIFGFQRVRSFHIEGKKTGLYSKVISSRCGRVIIPLNETKDDKSQIAEFIRQYNGEGIQHIALSSSDIFATHSILSQNGVLFQDTPDTYYDLIDARLPGHHEDVEQLRAAKILIDGGESQGGGFLLQIFAQNSIGPIFFEYIQRKGNNGFGEGNFQALFDSIELDQERRGVL